MLLPFSRLFVITGFVRGNPADGASDLDDLEIPIRSSTSPFRSREGRHTSALGTAADPSDEKGFSAPRTPCPNDSGGMEALDRTGSNTCPSAPPCLREPERGHWLFRAAWRICRPTNSSRTCRAGAYLSGRCAFASRKERGGTLYERRAVRVFPLPLHPSGRMVVGA
jgi:hypothetical protein